MSGIDRSELDAQLLEMLLANPAEMKKLLAKTASAPEVKTPVRRTFPRPEPDYIVNSTEVCILCDNVLHKVFYMIWNGDTRAFDSSKRGFEVTSTTPTKYRHSVVQKCPHCSTRLKELSEASSGPALLVEKLLTLGTALERSMTALEVGKRLADYTAETQLELFTNGGGE